MASLKTTKRKNDLLLSTNFWSFKFFLLKLRHFFMNDSNSFKLSNNAMIIFHIYNIPNFPTQPPPQKKIFFWLYPHGNRETLSIIGWFLTNLTRSPFQCVFHFWWRFLCLRWWISFLGCFIMNLEWVWSISPINREWMVRWKTVKYLRNCLVVGYLMMTTNKRLAR